MNILIVGLGSISSKHIIAIKKNLSNFKLFGLRSNSKSKKIGDVESIFNLKELEVKIDFSIISNPTHLHEKTILNLIELRCPLFIEKPVLSNLKNIVSISKMIEIHKIKTYTACNLRFHPLIIFIKKYFSDKKNEINEINVYCGSFLPEWRNVKNFKESYSANAEMGGGVHLDLIHELDYCTWIFGMPINVYKNFRSASSLNISSIDSAQYILEYKNFNINIKLNYYRVDTKREIEVLLKNETLVGDLLKNSLKSLKTNKIIFKGKYRIINTYVDQMRYFIECIKSNNKLMNDFNESSSILKLALNE